MHHMKGDVDVLYRQNHARHQRQAGKLARDHRNFKAPKKKGIDNKDRGSRGQLGKGGRKERRQKCMSVFPRALGKGEGLSVAIFEEFIHVMVFVVL
jgi:hypothetical protein